ncbi:hypothetical protein TNCV_459641 [Trichonephila clavipes]|nr:hypothetical protein TNCV_459641 [Trichonephila clavipes]
MSIINSWLEYKRDASLRVPLKNQMVLLNFTSHIAETVIILKTATHIKRRRPSDTDDNKERKAILRTSTDDAQKKKDALKKARPVSRLIREPVTVDNSFSDLESENNKEQVARRKILKHSDPKTQATSLK